MRQPSRGQWPIDESVAPPLAVKINRAVAWVTARPFVFNDSINLDNVGRVKISWGIRRYPQEASYEKKVNNEALMLYIFFGKEKVSSGNVLIPNSPYFIGLFLCQDEQVNLPYKGRYFHTGGRFVCLGKPGPGEMIVSEFDLDHAFRSYFGKQRTPGITGIGLGIDTAKAGGGGKGAAFLKSIEFFERQTGKIQGHSQEQFLSERSRARVARNHAGELVEALYWLGCEWGVCRRFHAENVSTPERHTWRLALAADPGPQRASIGRRTVSR